MPGSHPEATREVLWLVEYGWDMARADAVTALYGSHRDHVDRLGETGALLMIGRTAENQAMALFQDEVTARQFLTRDPLFVTEVAAALSVRSWQIVRYATGPGTRVP